MSSQGSMDGVTEVERLAHLKKMYFHMSRAEDLDAVFKSAVDDYDAGVLTEEEFEVSCLTIIGESNSGKTREIRHAIARLEASGHVLKCGRAIKSLRVFLDGATTWKALGINILENVGYDITARRTEHEIWSRVRQQLRREGIWIIHIDECQHMFENLGPKETRTVINSIKTMAKHPDWQVVVILSGIPELLEKVNLDPQLRNLTTAYFMRPLDPNSEEDLNEIDTAFYHYAAARGADIAGVRNEDTYRRMCYAHGHHFGRVFKFMVRLFAEVEDGDKRIDLGMMAESYAKKSGCIPGHNPFVRPDYKICEVDVLLAGVDK